MTSHDWQSTDKEFYWKPLIADHIIIVDPNAKCGWYICSRCQDKAKIDDVCWPEARVTANWRADCDLYLVNKIHDS